MPELSPEEQMEVEAHRRSRVVAAFRLGSHAGPAAAGPSWLGPLLAGAAIAVAIAIILGMVTLAQNTSRAAATHSPTPIATPSTR